MKQLRAKWIVGVCVVAVVVVLCFPVRRAIEDYRSRRELEARTATFDGDSTELSNTVILPAFDSPMVPGKNNIWCSSFQLAWNEMKDSVIKEPIAVSGAEDVADRLNNAKQTKSDLAPESYYATAGVKSPGFVEKMHSDLSARFPSVEPPVFDSNDPGDSNVELVAYAYLENYVKFNIPFRQWEREMNFTDSQGNKTAVSSFGLWEGFLPRYERLCRQIDVLYWRYPDQGSQFECAEFALDLCRDSQPYQIVVAMIEPRESLEATYTDLQQKIAAFHEDSGRDTLFERFQGADTLQVPDFFWRITHHFAELEGKGLANNAFQNWPIVTAMQVIDFRLDRSGAILKSEARSAIAAEPREFCLNKPFLVYLKKRDAAQPFFVMWVDNAELLTPFEV